MLSLDVPFDFSVFANEAAEGANISAYLCYINPDQEAPKEYRNLKLVFADKSLTPPPQDSIYRSYNTSANPLNFADREYVETTYKFDGNGRITASYNYDRWSDWDKNSNTRLPWYNDSDTGNNIRKVVFRDKIAPKSIAGWFYHCQYLAKIENIENLDTSKCENMTMAFWYANTGKAKYVDENGTVTDSAYLETLDLSNHDTSKVKK